MPQLPTENILCRTDSYKVTHWRQYPPGVQKVYSYFESRGGRFHDVAFFGLQYYLKRYLEGVVVTQEKIEQADELFRLHFADKEGYLFNRQAWEDMVNYYHGRLPVTIKAPLEGSVIPGHNVMMTIENTDPRFYWLPNYLETLLVQTWYGCTVATQSREMKKLILRYLRSTGDPAQVGFKLHDFGFRGVSSVETAGIGGAAHLINFLGTDTFEGIMVARDYYSEPMVGFSIPAAEHSTITSWGRENELKAMKNMLTQFSSGLVAVVSDSFNIYEACHDIWGDKLHDLVMERDGTLVIRPDSGDPVAVICEILSILGEKFGYTVNEKGYKVLDPHVRLIQGDGIDFDMLNSILKAMKRTEWSADNIAFGSGGGLLQKLNRDTLKFAFKCSSITINGEERPVFKSPITDKGKKSKQGRLKLICVEGIRGLSYKTVSSVDEPELYRDSQDEMVEVFRNGELIVDQSFADIRKRAEINEREL